MNKENILSVLENYNSQIISNITVHSILEAKKIQEAFAVLLRK